MKKAQGLTGMRAFMLIWVGQLVSLVGTGMTRFAISLWAWELTGKATSLALVTFFSYAPALALSPIAGALVDRWDRKLIMMVSDFAAGLSSIFLFVMSMRGELQIWHVYAAAAFAGAFEAFQYPAYGAAITMMVDKAHYSRTSALRGLAFNTSRIFAPVIAASLYIFIKLEGILTIDIVTFLFAVTTLLFVYIPRPERSTDGAESQGNLLQEASYGFRYIWRRKPFLGMETLFFVSNILFATVLVLMSPYILARTGDNGLQLSTVNAAMGIGAVIGGIAIASSGGFKRHIRGVFIGWLVWAFMGAIFFGLTQTVFVWVILAVTGGFAQPLIDASSQAILQRKVPPDVQGKFFAVSRMVSQVPALLSMVIAGPLADYVFEPAMQPGGSLAGTFGKIVGVGQGAGIGLLFVIVGIIEVIVIAVAISIPLIRNMEDLIADHDSLVSDDAEKLVVA